MFLVERDTVGLSVARQLDKIGWRCSDTAELAFEDAFLPADRLLGEENAVLLRNHEELSERTSDCFRDLRGGSQQGD